MALPAFIERVTHEDTDSTRYLSSHDIENAMCAIHGGTITVASFKTAVSATTDDETDIDNLVALVSAHSKLDDKNQEVLRIMGTLGLAHHGYFNAATARTKLGIATP